MCTETTRRSVDFNGDGKWRLKDTLIEALSFRDRQETRTTLEINGNPSDTDRYKLKGTFSGGEFGGVLQAVFRSESKADFQWKETDALKAEAGRVERGQGEQGQAGTVQVFDYRVDAANSSFSVTGSNGQRIVVGFHGQVFIESTTRRVRRVTLIADNLPADFPTRSTSMGVDYDYVAINGLKYMMPVSAELRLSQGPREVLMNTMEFGDYKRFATDLKPAGFTPADHP
jgi:hypothetical protein